MKTILFTMASSLAIGALFSNDAPAQDGKPQSLEERISYAYGVVVARDLKNKGLSINIDQFVKAFFLRQRGKGIPSLRSGNRKGL